MSQSGGVGISKHPCLQGNTEKLPETVRSNFVRTLEKKSLQQPSNCYVKKKQKTRKLCGIFTYPCQTLFLAWQQF